MRIEYCNFTDTEDPAFQALNQELRERAAELGTRRGVPAEALNQLIQGVDEPGAFADLVAFYLELPTEDKQALLETLDDEERMRAALVAVERELARLDAQEEIQARVQEELGERQREMLLREHTSAIFFGFSSLNTCIRNVPMITPLSVAIPNRAMNPTQTATLRLTVWT